jgi:hypothetical protein
MRFLIAVMLLGAAPLHAQSNPPIWRLSEELRIGSVDGPRALSRVQSLTVSSDGAALFVAQPLEHTIRVFDAVSGQPVRQIGRHGEGPGEFRMVEYIGWKADTLYATDFLLKRVSLFAANGEHFRTKVINPAVDPATGRGSHPLGMTAEGNVISRSGLTSAMVASGQVAATPWALVNWEGRVIRNIGMLDLRETTGIAKAGTNRFYFSQPLSRRSFLAVHPDGQILVSVQQPAGGDPPGAYEVVGMKADGSRLFARAYRYTPRAVPREAADSLREVLARDLALAVPADLARSAAREYVAVPTHHPPISWVVVGRDNTIWLRGEDVGSGTVGWLVLDSRGGILARVSAPAKLRILYADESAVWGVVHDDLDVPYVVRSLIRR